MLRAGWLAARTARQLQTCSPARHFIKESGSSSSPAAFNLLGRDEVSFSFCPSGRGFAAATEPAEQRVQLPARVTGLAGKYAAALYTAGYKAKALEQIENDLIEIWNTAARSKEFRNFLKDPSIPKGEKDEGLQAVLKDLKVSEITQRFMGVLAENNRLAEIIRICNSFDDLMAAARGEVTATITTAAELSRKEVDELKTGLNQILEKGQKLILQEQVNPSIIGGIVIDVGDKHIDLSISSRVKRVQQLILETV